MKANKSIVLLIVILSAGQISAQEFKNMMIDRNVNFYEVVEQANQYFKTHEKDNKGSGWKGYQRWKEANEYKYYPSGERSNISPYFVEDQYRAFLSSNPPALKLFDNGWNDLGPYSVDSITTHYAPGLGRIEDLYVDPENPDRIYVGSRSGGFWRTLDGGLNWEGGSTDFLIASGVNTMAVSPTDPDSILINIQNAQNETTHGIYRSVDGGLSWNETNFNPLNIGFGGLGDDTHINQIKYHPSIPGLVFIGTTNGLYRSTDDLNTWSQVAGGRVTEIDFHPVDPSVIYAYDYQTGSLNNRIIRSFDGGISFTNSGIIPANSTNNRGNRVSVSPDCPDCVYFASPDGVWRSADQGSSFSLLSNPDLSSDGFIVNDLDESKMLTGVIDGFASLDGGLNFNQVTWWGLFDVDFNSGQYVHADLRVGESINGVYYIGTDGFLCRSDDDGFTWEIIGNGMGIRENYNLGVSQSNHYRSISGSQDNGTSIRHKDTWIEFGGADGMEGIIHPLNDDWMIGSQQFGNRLRTKDGGITQDDATPPGQSGAWISPFVFDPLNPMRIYSFGELIHRSDDFGSTWTDLGSPGFSGEITHADIGKINSDILVCARYESIEKSTDGGMNFFSIKNTLPNYSITDIAMSPDNDDIIVVTYARYQADGKKVFITYDGGGNWQNITYNLGNMPIRSVVIDHTDGANIYLGAEIGVFTMPMYGSSWELYNESLPNMSVRELDVVYGSNTIRAATWGRGLWEYSLVGRNEFPSIVNVEISDPVTENSPLAGSGQFVNAAISYENTLSSVWVKWSLNSTDLSNTVLMNNVSDSSWVSESALPCPNEGDRIYFSVFAAGASGDTTETYRFMYEVQAFQYCSAAGSSGTGGDFINYVSLNGIENNSGQEYYGDFTDISIDLYKDSTYTLQYGLNYSFPPSIAGAWIDFDRNAQFDEYESIMMGDFDGSHQTFGTFIVPSDAVVGDTIRLRVRNHYWETEPFPCGVTAGEVEDYSIVIHEIIPVQCTAGAQVMGLTAMPSPNGSSASLSWDVLPNTDFYQAKGRRLGTAPFGQFVTANTFKNVGGLQSGSCYEWKVRARCSSGPTVEISQFSEMDTFCTTAPSKLTDLRLQATMEIFPNPTKEAVQIALSGFSAGRIHYELSGITGIIVSGGNTNSQNGSALLSLDLKDLSPGIYAVKIKQGNTRIIKPMVIY